jgi:AcrR family transcriptional regulator
MSRIADPTAKISLLRAAEAVFAEKGLTTARVEEIARRAGLSKGAFYLHFESKEDALKEVVESFLARCGGQLPPPRAYPDLPSDPGELLGFWLERDQQMYEFLWQNRAVLQILKGCESTHTYLVETFRREIEATCREWVEFWKSRRLFRSEVDTDLVSSLICGAYHELSRKMLDFSRRPPLGAWLRDTMHLFVRGLGTPELIAVLETEPSENQEVPSRIERRVADDKEESPRRRAT